MHARLADLLRSYDANDHPASVKVFAVNPRRQSPSISRYLEVVRLDRADRSGYVTSLKSELSDLESRR